MAQSISKVIQDKLQLKARKYSTCNRIKERQDNKIDSINVYVYLQRSSYNEVIDKADFADRSPGKDREPVKGVDFDKTSITAFKMFTFFPDRFHLS